ncbi:MAG: response regulator [Archangium sp.]|nr:response regulator [Archangium sp.]
MKLLVVDDVAVNRLTLLALLEDDGHQVDEAESCAQARERLQAGHYDVVLLDLGLPDGNGVTLIPDIRLHPQTRIVLTSGSDVAGLDALVDGVTTKGESYAVLQGLLAGFA